MWCKQLCELTTLATKQESGIYIRITDVAKRNDPKRIRYLHNMHICLEILLDIDYVTLCIVE